MSRPSEKLNPKRPEQEICINYRKSRTWSEIQKAEFPPSVKLLRQRGDRTHTLKSTITFQCINPCQKHFGAMILYLHNSYHSLAVWLSENRDLWVSCFNPAYEAMRSLSSRSSKLSSSSIVSILVIFFNRKGYRQHDYSINSCYPFLKVTLSQPFRSQSG